jgi:hypothetical protein
MMMYTMLYFMYTPFTVKDAFSPLGRRAVYRYSIKQGMS